MPADHPPSLSPQMPPTVASRDGDDLQEIASAIAARVEDDHYLALIGPLMMRLAMKHRNGTLSQADWACVEALAERYWQHWISGGSTAVPVAADRPVETSRPSEANASG